MLLYPVIKDLEYNRTKLGARGWIFARRSRHRSPDGLSPNRLDDSLGKRAKRVRNWNGRYKRWREI